MIAFVAASLFASIPPSAVPPTPVACGVTAIAAGYYHSLALRADGTVWTFGGNFLGELGVGTRIPSRVPVQVVGLTDVVAISGHDLHSLALRSDGTVWEWGSVGSDVPLQVAGLSGVVAIVAGSQHSLAVLSDGTLRAWGANQQGQLGNGTTTSSSVPVAVQNLSGVTAVAASYGSSYAIRSDGTLWSWGANAVGQLGNGTILDSNVPVWVTGLPDVSQVTALGSFALALGSDGTAWIWGDNRHAPLRTATPPLPSSVPVLLGPNVRSIGAGIDHALVASIDGTVWTWGKGLWGQLGTGGGHESSSATLVPGSSGVTAVAGGHWHSLALRADATLWAWGYNQYGQLGIGSVVDASLPVPSVPRLSVSAPLSARIGESGLTASTPATPGSVYEWSVNAGPPATGQGTSAITFDAGPAGTTMRIAVLETAGGGCAQAPGASATQVDFADVPPGDPFHAVVNTLARSGITTGCGGGRFCPDAPITRAQLAVFLLRALHGERFVPRPATGSVFSDVQAGDFAASWIEELVGEGLSGGCGGGQFCPDALLERAQAAVLLLRAEHLDYEPGYQPKPASGRRFADVAKGDFAADCTHRSAFDPARRLKSDPPWRR